MAKEHLQALRRHTALSQHAFGKRIQTHEVYVSGLERGIYNIGAIVGGRIYAAFRDEMEELGIDLADLQSPNARSDAGE